MISRLITFVLVLCLLQQDASSCTTFLLHRGDQLVFGRNYDWVTGNGFVCTNQRGLAKHSAVKADGDLLKWTSSYGSITFNQYGKEFPTGGMNEKGLVVELMWLDDTRYPETDSRPTIGALQWIQYQLDCHATVAEVIASDAKMRINTSDVPLHYLVADKTGATATIEFLNGKMVAHTRSSLQLPVLTNETYDLSVKARSDAGTLANNSHQRFATACSMLETFQNSATATSATDHAFKMLAAVSQGNFTKWSIVYDINRGIIQFHTFDAPQTKTIAFKNFNFDCKEASLMLDMNAKLDGDISAYLTPFSSGSNLGFIRKSAAETRSRVDISETDIRRQSDYPKSINCQSEF